MRDNTKYLITIGFLAVLLLMVSLVIVAITEFRSSNQKMSGLVEETYATMQAANSMRDAIRLRAHNLLKMQLTDDPFERDEAYMRFLDNAGRYRLARDQLVGRELGDEEAIILDELTLLTRIAQPYNDRASELLIIEAERGDLPEVLVKAESYQADILDQLNQLVKLVHRDAERALQIANANYAETRNLLLIMTFLAILLSMVVAWLVVRDVARKNQKISYQATHDSLTGLINRREFERRLANALDTARVDGRGHVLLYLDLDQFKVVNDSCGHVAGDQLLKQLPRLFNQQIRRHDTVARLGGDEFGLLLEDCDLSSATLLAEKLRNVVNDFRFCWDSKCFTIGVSIGIVTITELNENIDELLSMADAACYAAKDNGRNLVHIYDAEDQQLLQQRGQMQWITRLTSALEQEQFSLFLQPIVATNDADSPPDYFEALIRFRDQDGKLYLPGAFLPAAERYGKIVDIDRWVVQHALKWLAKRENRDRYLSVNLSGRSLTDESLTTEIKKMVKRSSIAPGHLCFEITETAAIASYDIAVNFMHELKSVGCRFALDDFGSGLSSFSYLKNLPVDILKIDGSFVRTIDENPLDLAMVRSINEIGHLLGMKTVAEYVESDAILKRLQAIGVDYVQGYAIGKPFPMDELAGSGNHSPRVRG